MTKEIEKQIEKVEKYLIKKYGKTKMTRNDVADEMLSTPITITRKRKHFIDFTPRGVAEYIVTMT